MLTRILDENFAVNYLTLFVRTRPLLQLGGTSPESTPHSCRFSDRRSFPRRTRSSPSIPTPSGCGWNSPCYCRRGKSTILLSYLIKNTYQMKCQSRIVYNSTEREGELLTEEREVMIDSATTTLQYSC